MSRIPLDLFAEVTTSTGTRYPWDANQPAGSRVRNARFGTKIGEGFSDGSGSLARRIDLDYPDLELGATVALTGADGTVAYEGRIEAMPRELAGSHSIGVTLAGWMTAAKRRRFREIFVDRGLSDWHGMSVGRKAALMVGSRMVFDGEQYTDTATSKSGVATPFVGDWISPYTPISEAWYDAGPGVTIGKIGYSWEREANSTNPGDAQWAWLVGTSSDDKGTATDLSANLRAAGPSTLQTFTSTDGYRYAFLNHEYTGTPSGAQGVRYSIDWYKLAVYGTHGLPLHTGEPGEPDGVYASDVLRYLIARYCPKLDPSGVQDTDYVIQHLAFKDRTYPYDAFLEVNKFHLWHLGVWENRRLDFRPYDFTDYQWEIRTDDNGTTFTPQGESTQDLFNGIVVSYVDLLTGTRHELTPETHPELRDASSSNPWNAHGDETWDELELSSPTLEPQALQLGRAILADRNRPKAPGTITVTGYIRDRAGNEQPAWRPRAGEMISITNFPNDRPRLIVETDYDDETKTLRIAVDRPFQLLDAYLDRAASARGARSLA